MITKLQNFKLSSDFFTLIGRLYYTNQFYWYFMMNFFSKKTKEERYKLRKIDKNEMKINVNKYKDYCLYWTLEIPYFQKIEMKFI
jgi:hypothetical protein